MPKQTKLQKEFLAQLKQLSANDTNPARKKTKGKGKGNTGKRSKQTKVAKSGSVTKRQPIPKDSVKAKKHPKQSRRTKDIESPKYTGKGHLKIEPYQRGSNRLSTSFGKVRKIENKIDLFANSESLQKEIKKQLSRKGGKPPKGMIIIVKDKKGNEAAHVTMPSFVVNEGNIQKEIKKFLKELKKDYSKYAESLSDGGKAGDTFDVLGVGERDSEADGYESYNPDNIVNIDIQFIY